MKDNKLIDDPKIQKRRDYMKKYYRKKKAERIKLGTCVSICRGKVLRKSNNFEIKKGEFIISFS